MVVDRAEEIAPQRQDDGDLAARLARRAQQVADECAALLLVLAERVEFLELIDQQDDAGRPDIRAAR